MGHKVAVSYGHGKNTYEDKRSKFVIKDGKVYEEHDHNAEVGIRVTAALKKLGFNVLEVQPAHGLDVALGTRTAQANAWGAELYWSVHANAAGASAKGWCAFYWKGSTQGAKIAKLYAQEMAALGLPLYGNSEAGKGTYASEKGTWSDFHELRETHMVACLTENGFMTNSEDFKKIFLNENGHYDKLAFAHVRAICAYFGVKYDPIKSGEKKPAPVAPAPKPPTKPAPVKPTPAPSKGVKRVKVDGKQVGAFGDDKNVIEAVEKALKAGAKNVTIERV